MYSAYNTPGVILINKTNQTEHLHNTVKLFSDGFCGPVVCMLASGSRVRGFKPGRSCWIFLYIKILIMPSFGGEVK
jgi:hypothetical protein